MELTAATQDTAADAEEGRASSSGGGIYHTRSISDDLLLSVWGFCPSLSSFHRRCCACSSCWQLLLLLPPRGHFCW